MWNLELVLRMQNAMTISSMQTVHKYALHNYVRKFRVKSIFHAINLLMFILQYKKFRVNLHGTFCSYILNVFSPALRYSP